MTLNNLSGETEVTFDPDLTTAGTYALIIESYDLNSSLRSILKTETFTITIFDSPPNFDDMDLLAGESETWNVTPIALSASSIDPLPPNMLLPSPLSANPELFTYSYVDNTMSFIGGPDSI